MYGANGEDVHTGPHWCVSWGVCVCVCVEVASLTGNKSASSKEKEGRHSQHSVLWLQY